MSYIPGSHNFVYHIKKLIYEKKIPYITIKYLKDLKIWLEDKNNFELIKKNLKNNKLLYEFLESLEPFNKKDDPVEFDYEMNPGDAIIFDENGFHKGTKTLFSDRMVLRYHYVRKKNLI